MTCVTVDDVYGAALELVAEYDEARERPA